MLAAGILSAHARAAHIDALSSATPEDVLAWLAAVQLGRYQPGYPAVNTEQKAALRKVVLRVAEELRASGAANADFGEPLRWLVHGGPGTSYNKHAAGELPTKSDGLRRGCLHGFPYFFRSAASL